ncbi:hypothetical protein [Pseudarthrobacter siccitolerans]
MTEADLPMPLPLLLGLVGLASAVITAALAALSKKWRTPADDREDRKIGIEADERLLARFEKLLEERDKRIDGLVAEVKEVRAIAEKAANANRILIDWIYAAVRVVRELGGIDLLPDPPEGVVIADHPSSLTRTKE